MKKIIRLLAILMMAMLIAAAFVPAAFAETGSDGVDGSVGDGLNSYGSVEEIVRHMSTRQKITQCLMMDFRKWNDGKGEAAGMTVLDPEVAEIMAEYQFGSIILFAENLAGTTEQALQLTKDMQAAAMGSDGLPLLIATDQEGGIVYRLGSGTALPGNMALGATGDPKNAKTAGQIIGRELSSVGINTTLAPVIDVNNNPNNSIIGLRAFSDDAQTVGKFGSAYISGLNEYNIIGCAKHYPGHGDTSTDSHYGLPVINKSIDELKKIEFVPYETAIADGIDMIMTAHILYPEVDDSKIISDKTGQEESRPATMSHVLLTEILRGDLGFSGVVVTDAMNMAGITDTYSEEQSTLESIKAGADLICMPVTGIYDKDELREKLDSIITYIEADLNSTEEGSLTMDRLDEAVTRVVKLKQSKGILDYDADSYTVEKALENVGSQENRELEGEISAKAVTLIRNNNDVLPYKATKDTKVLVMCPYNNERAQMVMGINRAKASGRIPKETEVKVYRYSSDDYTVKDGELMDALDWADFVIINSEVTGSAGMSYNHWTSLGPLNFTSYCKATGKTSVVMSVDKPYDVQLYPAADAVIAVYGDKGSSVDVTEELLDGGVTEDEKASGPNIAAGVEVIFGNYQATGRLPINIPVFNRATKTFTDEIRYSRGYGLRYVTKPGKAKIKKVTAGKRSIKVRAAAKASSLNGSTYQLAYRYAGSIKWHYKKFTGRTITVKGLKKGRKCIVRLRALSTQNGKTYSGKWSKAVKSAKIR